MILHNSSLFSKKRVHYDPGSLQPYYPKERLRKPTPLKALYPERRRPKTVKLMKGPQGQRYVISPKTAQDEPEHKLEDKLHIPAWTMPAHHTYEHHADQLNYPYNYHTNQKHAQYPEQQHGHNDNKGHVHHANAKHAHQPDTNLDHHLDNTHAHHDDQHHVNSDHPNHTHHTDQHDARHKEGKGHSSDKEGNHRRKLSRESKALSGKSSKRAPTYDSVASSRKSKENQTTPGGSAYKFQKLIRGTHSDDDSEPDLDFDQMEAATAHKLIEQILNNDNFERQLIRKARKLHGGSKKKFAGHTPPPKHSPKASKDNQTAAEHREHVSKPKSHSPQTSKHKSDQHSIKLENPEYLLRPRFIQQKDLHPMMQPCKDPPCPREVYTNIAVHTNINYIHCLQ